MGVCARLLLVIEQVVSEFSEMLKVECGSETVSCVSAGPAA